jgi:thiol:disulfide interchange protein DsbD
MARVVFLVLTVLIGLAVPAAAQVDLAPKVHARLVAERDAVAPGSTISVALVETIRDGWHTYWVNPGEAGAPTEIQWSLPPGWHAGPIAWPYPKRLPVPPFMNYGYEVRLWLLSNLTVPANAVPGTDVTLKAAVDWLVCKEVCIPEDATVTLPLRVAAASAPSTPSVAAEFAAARAKLPVASPWPFRYRLTASSLDLFAQAPALARAHPADAQFFPLKGNVVKDTAEQRLGFAGDGVVLRLVPSKKFHRGDALAGVLVLTSADGSVAALDVNAQPGPVPDAEFTTASDMGFALAVLFAFVGGLILNLMPCVLPVLAMKALALASHAGADRAEARNEGLAYGAGALLSFLAFGAVLVALRAGGAAIGWGYQLQEPIVVALLALLMVAVGLNLSGVYEVAPVTAGEALVRRGGAAGSFFTGVLAVAVAAPCTAPFMAAALGYALEEPTSVAMAVFAALGVGFALPFILLGLFPALQRILPKPGAWMLWLRRLLAFPMYGAAAWLVWVLAQQTDALGVGATLGAIVVLALALWIYGATRGLSPRGRGVGALGALVILIAALSLLTLLHGAASPALAANEAAIPSIAYSADRLDALRREGRPVFVDATAAWCITCLVNEKAVLSQPAVRNAFGAKHVAYVVADWTNRNSAIAALLEAHGRSGVPLYLYYAPGAPEPVVLPQILTDDAVLKAINP